MIHTDNKQKQYIQQVLVDRRAQGRYEFVARSHVRAWQTAKAKNDKKTNYCQIGCHVVSFYHLLVFLAVERLLVFFAFANAPPNPLHGPGHGGGHMRARGLALGTGPNIHRLNIYTPVYVECIYIKCNIPYIICQLF